MNKNAIISTSILTKMAEGMDVAEAIDAVLGAGTYAKVTGEIYDELRSKANK